MSGIRTVQITDSSCIRSLEFFPEKEELRVWFSETSYPTTYAGVTPAVFGRVVGAKSVGKAYNRIIKNHYIGTTTSP